MNRDNFDYLVVFLHSWFNKTPPKKSTVDVWFDNQNLPDRCFDFIKAKIQIDKFPQDGNIPKYFTHLFREWRSNSRNGTDDRPEGCSQCHHGYFSVIDWNGRPRCYRCEDCQTAKVEAVPMAKKSELLKLGYKLHWSEGTVQEIMDLPAFEKGLRCMPDGIKAIMENSNQSRLKPEDKPAMIGEVILREPGEEG